MNGYNAFDARQAIDIHNGGSKPQENGGEHQHTGRLEGRILGGCRLLHLISAGGMGEVYLAEQIRLGNRSVAVKVVRPEQVVAPRVSAAPNMETRFMREGKLLGKFTHPNILPVHDSGIDGEYLYLVTQYTPDGSLADAIRGTAPHRLSLPVRLPLAVDIIQQIASALQYTHDHGVVHRDVKPANVLVERELNGHRRMLLADFGIARGVETLAQSNDISGTATYMAPEQFSGTFSPASDQYGLAIIAYLLLAGRPPFTGSVAEVTRAHIFDAPPSLHLFNSSVPPAVEQVIARALSKYPTERYPSVSAFAQALRRAATHDDANDDKTIPGTFPARMVGMEARGISAAVAATQSRGATRPALEAGLQPLDTLYRKLNPSPANRSTTAPLPIWLGGADGDGRTADDDTSPHSDARRSDTRRRAVVFVISAVLLAVAAAAAIKLGPLYTSRGYTPSSHTLTPSASSLGAATTQTTPTTVQPTASPDKASLIALSAPQRLAPGQHFTIAITLTNTGTSAWSGGDGYRLVCDTLNHAQNFCPNGLSIGLGDRTIAPGQSAYYTLALVAPSQSGSYTTSVNMARNGALFSTPDITASFVVKSALPAPAATRRPAPTSTPRPAPTATPRPAPTATPPPAPTVTPAPPAPTVTPAPVPTAPAVPVATNTPAPVPTATTASPPAAPPLPTTTP